MGFDSECIVNIQSLPGEYFCPVCRHLIYPNEALQSLCTHLYCKPCLTYVASTTRACPYDGYLVTEADSKPLIESNKTLADSIGKLPVLCLYHKSGCAWQGSFSDCASHCSECAFGNSPVVCNRCGVQMVHRQTQEHVQNCPGVNAQAQQAVSSLDPPAASNAASIDKSQNVSQAAANVSQATAVTSADQDSNQPAIQNSQNQAANQSTVQLTAEQWHKQQQQYQQFYQQYPGYDPYQQQYQYYYPYQQPAVTQYQHLQMQTYGYGHTQPPAHFQNQPQTFPQSQTQMQAQAQILSQPQSQPQPGQTQQHTYGQPPLNVPPQNQAQLQSNMQGMTSVQSQHQMKLQSQPQSNIYPPAQSQALGQPHHMQPQPQPQPQPQQLVPIPQYQQPQAQNPPPQQAQNYPVSQPHYLPQMPPQGPTRHFPLSQPNRPPRPNVPPQTLPASANAGTGHQSYPQSQHHVQMHEMGPQVLSQLLPHAVSQSSSKPPVQMPSQVPQQGPLVSSNHSNAPFPNQLQQASLPSGQGPPLQPAFFPHAQQHPGVQTRQHVAQPFSQQQLAVRSQLQPQTLLETSLQYANSYPQLPPNPAFSHNLLQNQPLSTAGRPILPHAAVSQSYLQSNTVGAVRSVNPAQLLPGNESNLVSNSGQLQLSTTEMSRVQGSIEKPGEFTQLQAGSQNAFEKGANFGAASRLADTLPKKPVRPEFEQKHSTGENEQSGESAIAKEITESLQTPVNDSMFTVPENVDPADTKHLGKGEAAGIALQPSEKVERGKPDKKIQSRTMIIPSVKLPEDGPGIMGPTTSATHDPVPLADHGLYPTQNPGPTLQPGHSGQHYNPAEYSQTSITKQPIHLEMRQSIVTLPGSLASHERETTFSGTIMGPHDQTQGPGFYPARPKGRHSESVQKPNARVVANLPGQLHPSNLMDSELFPNNKVPAGFPERMKNFSAPQFVEFENKMRKLPRPPHFDSELVSRFGSYPSGPPERDNHALARDGGFRLNSGVPSAASRTYPPHLSNEPGGRPFGFHGENEGMLDDIHAPPDYLGPGPPEYLAGPGYGHYLADSFTPRGRRVDGHPDMSSSRLGFRGGLASKSGYDGFDSRHLEDQVFHDGRFPSFPSHLRKSEFDNGGLRMSGEHMGPRNIPQHLEFGDRHGLGPVSPEFVGRGNGPGYPRFGEPGFRSRFSLHGFPNDDSSFAGRDDPAFENFKRSKPASMGWCRICKVDCETIEGLVNHSQTRAHQKAAMDIVKNIKQNSKKRKLASTEVSSTDNLNKLRNTGFENRRI